MKFDPIRATVSDQTITKVTRLFNGTLKDILNELLQNARRAGATLVTVGARPDGNGLRITIDDDGCGIDDPARVIALGASSWSESVARGEDPAGMGVFSLAGRHTTIESRSASATTGWKIAISATAWTGEEDIAVEAVEREPGTAISFLIAEIHEEGLARELRNAAEFFPVPVKFNGGVLPRKDFLAGAVHVEDWQGSRIGIFKGRPYQQTPNVNFHGVTLYSKLFHLPQIGREEIHARIDIGHSPALQLVLPARKEFVENDGYRALLKAAELACYRAVAAQTTHSLSFEHFCKARALGIALDEAEAILREWEPDIADNDTSSGPLGELRPITGDEFLMEPHEAHFEQAIARALAGHAIRSGLVEPNEQFAGYQWYDSLRLFADPIFIVATEQGTHRVNGLAAEPPLPTITEADRITLEYEIAEQGTTGAPRETIVADIVFAFPDGCCSDGLDDMTIAFVKSDKLTPDSLVDLLDNACFSAWNDSDADSWDTQHDRFLRDAREIAYRILIDENAAIASQFRDAVARIMWVLPKGKRVAISFTHGSAIDVVVSDEGAGE